MATPYECRRVMGKNIIDLAPAYEIVGASTVVGNTTLSSVSASRYCYYGSLTGSYTISLPSSPYEGMVFYFQETAGSTNLVVISGNGKLIANASQLWLQLAYQRITLRYSGSQWLIDGGN